MISNFGIAFLVSFLISFLFYLLKQPTISAYLLSGFLITQFLNLQNFQVFDIFAELGLVTLLFLVGLNLKLDFFKEIGKKALILGISQELITILLTFLFLILLNFDKQTALILAIAFSFSSTILVVKIFSEKKVIDTFYGKLTIGFMIVQDILAIILLALLPLKISFNWLKFISGFLLIFILFIFLPKLIKKFEKRIESSVEILFLFSLAFLFLIINLLGYFNFSSEIGALIAGLLLSNTNFAREISSRFSSLRDFFIIAFFIYLGSFLNLVHFNFSLPIILISLFILIINPLIVMIILKFLKVPPRVNFIVSLTAGQISEFSFIFVNAAYKNNLVSQETLSLVSLIGLVTIFISSYLIYFSDWLYKKIRYKFYLHKEKIQSVLNDYEVVLFGCDRTGRFIKNVLKEKNINFLVIDYNPEIVDSLKKENINAIYGDGGDIDLLEEILHPNLKAVISTLPSKNLNLLIAKVARQKNPAVKLISVFYNEKDIAELKKAGFDYIFWPHHLGGNFLASLIKKFEFKIEEYPHFF